MKNSCLLLLSVICYLSFIEVQGQPSIGGFSVYYGLLHNHSDVSDGTGTPQEAYRYARDNGNLDFFSLTDHSEQMDADEWATIKATADEYNQPGVFTTLHGFEWTSYGLGHVTVINSQDYISSDSPYDSFGSLCEWLENHDCVAFFNHPGRYNSQDLEFGHFAGTPTSHMVGMELLNREERFEVFYYTDGYYRGDGHLGLYDEALTRGWMIGASGSEDNHTGNWGTATASRLAILAPANTREDLYEALKAKRFYSTYDKNLALSFQVGGHEMGSSISAGTHPFTLQASDADGEAFSRVELLKNGEVVKSWTLNSSTVFVSEELTCHQGEYYYIRIKQADDDEAISSPIWVNKANLLPSSRLTSPEEQSLHFSPATVTVSAMANDEDGSIAKVEFYEGTSLVGVNYYSPYSIAWENVPAGNYQLTVKCIDNLGGSSISQPVEFSVLNEGEPVHLVSRIASSLDDMEESSNGNISHNEYSTDLELVNDPDTKAEDQVVGLRFSQLNIPRNAFIQQAFLRFTCDEPCQGDCRLTIAGEAADQASPFSTNPFNVSGRTSTLSQVEWTPDDWTEVGESGSAQQSPDIASILQEIVSRQGEESTAAINLLIKGTGRRTAKSYEGNPGQAALLEITYTYYSTNEQPRVSIVNPENEATCMAPAIIAIDAEASDVDGAVLKVDFYLDGILHGSDHSRPFSVDWMNVQAGTYLLTAVATDNKGDSAVSPGVRVVVTPEIVNRVFSTRIALPADDVEESAKGLINLYGDDIELTFDSRNTGNQIIGLRFSEVTIPKEASITRAWIQFTADEKTRSGCTMVIRGEKADDSQEFSSTPKNVSLRERTTEAVNWIPAGWTQVGLSGAAQQTPDLKAIVQEIVNSPGWRENNSLSFIITGLGIITPSGTGKRTAVSFESAVFKSAMLVVEYKTYADGKSNKMESREQDLTGKEEMRKRNEE